MSSPLSSIFAAAAASILRYFVGELGELELLVLRVHVDCELILIARRFSSVPCTYRLEPANVSLCSMVSIVGTKLL